MKGNKTMRKELIEFMKWYNDVSYIEYENEEDLIDKYLSSNPTKEIEFCPVCKEMLGYLEHRNLQFCLNPNCDYTDQAKSNNKALDT